MKINKATLTGLVVGLVVGVSAVLIVNPRPPQPVYDSLRIDGNILKTLYNGNFSKMILDFQTASGSSKIDLLPGVYNSSGVLVAPPAGLLRVLTTGNTISGSRVLSGFSLEHNRIKNLLQLQTLVSIMNENAGGYLELSAADYKNIDPTDLTHIYYQITPFRSDGSRINTSSINPKVFQLDPCPPARPY